MFIFELWFIVAFVAASLKAAFGTYQKHLSIDYDTFQLSYVLAIVGVLVFIPFVIHDTLTTHIPLTLGLLTAIAVQGVLSVAGLVGAFKAYETEDLSVFVPLVRVSPLFIALAEPLLFPSTTWTATTLAAAILGVAGAYVVMLEDAGLAEPLRRLTERGPQLALFVAGCSAAGALATRYAGVNQMPAATFSFATNVVMVSVLVLVLLYRGNALSPRAYLDRNYLALGGLSAVRQYVIVVAYAMATAAHVSLVFQLGIILTVLAGGVFFDEKYLLRRLFGAALIIAGVLLIA